MSNNELLGAKGGGKGKSGKQHTPVDYPDTLRSRQVARVLELITAGPIEGLVDGTNSIYLDDTPLSDYTSYAWSYDMRLGTTPQDRIDGFPATEVEKVVNVELTRDFNNVIRSTGTADVDAMRITIGVQALWKLQLSGKKVGDRTGASVTFAIDRRPQGGVWENVYDTSITGKSSGPYERDFIVEKPAGYTGFWDVRCRRTSTNGSNDYQYEDSVFWTRLTEINYVDLSYDGDAIVGITFDAEGTGGTIPRRSYKIKGKKVKIPSNYNPTTRVYSGAWNGLLTTTLYYTNNPAWVLLDLLMDEVNGCGFDSSSIDLSSFYEAGVYNDGLVPDGNGGQEPRFTFNYALTTRDDVWKVLQLVAGSMRGVLYNSGGVIILVQDRPKNAAAVFSKSNVVDGAFSYTSSGLKARHTSINVFWNDPSERFLTKTATLTDDDAVDKYGLNPTDVYAVGCTSEGQARRFGRWALYTEQQSTESVEFSIGLADAYLRPGDVIKVQDEDYSELKLSGRVSSASTTSITLDRPITLANSTYTISVLIGDGLTTEERTISQKNGTFTTLTPTTAFTSAPIKHHEFILSGPVLPRSFVVNSIRETSAGTFSVVGMFYDNDKFAYVDEAVAIPEKVYQDISLYRVSPVSGIAFVEESVQLEDGGRIIRLRVNWVAPPKEEKVVGYTVKWRRDDDNFQTINDVRQTSVVLDNVFGGTVEVIIYAYNVRGTTSSPASAIYNFDEARNSQLLPPLNLKVKNGDATFEGKDCTFVWEHNPNNSDGSRGDILSGYKIEIYNSTGTTLLRTEIVASNVVEYTYFYEINVGDGGPRREFQVRIYSVDTLVRTSSTYASKNISNPQPAITGVDLDGGFGGYWVSVNPIPADRDEVGYYVCASTSSGFTPSSSNVVYKGPSPSNFISAGSNSTYYVRVAGYDSFGDDIAGLTFTTQQSVSIQAEVQLKDFEFEGLLFKPNDGTTNKLTWTAGKAHILSGDNVDTYDISAGGLDWTSGTTYIYYIGGESILRSTNTITTALGSENHRIVAQYKGGTDLIAENGNAYLDGGKVIAQTIGASQLVAGSAVITNTAQIANSIITSAQIKNLAVDTIHLANSSVSDGYSQTANWRPTATYDGEWSYVGQFVFSFGTYDTILAINFQSLIAVGGTGSSITYNSYGGISSYTWMTAIVPIIYYAQAAGSSTWDTLATVVSTYSNTNPLGTSYFYSPSDSRTFNISAYRGGKFAVNVYTAHTRGSTNLSLTYDSGTEWRINYQIFRK